MKDNNLLSSLGKYLFEYLLSRHNRSKTFKFKTDKAIKVFRIAENNFKHFEMNRNAIHVKLFNNENNKLLLNAAIAKLIANHKYGIIVNNKLSLNTLEIINKKIYNEALIIKNFISINDIKTGHDILNYINEFLVDNVDKNAIENHEILIKFRKILEYFTPNTVHYYKVLIENNNNYVNQLDKVDLGNFMDVLIQNNIRIDNSFYLSTKDKLSEHIKNNKNVILDTINHNQMYDFKISNVKFPEANQKLLLAKNASTEPLVCIN